MQLVPFTWQDEVTLMETELARAGAMLALEEGKNAKLPPQTGGVEPGGACAALQRRGHRVHGLPEERMT